MPDDLTMRSKPISAGRTQISIGNMAEAARIVLEQRRARGEIMTYEFDGWIVREYPDQQVVRLARVGEFRAEDHPVVL